MKPDIIPPSRLLGNTQFKDGSLLVGWTEDSASVAVQHFSATGDALSPPHSLSGSLGLVDAADPPRFQFTMTGLGASALGSGWISLNLAGSSQIDPANHGDLGVSRITRGGAAMSGGSLLEITPDEIRLESKAARRATRSLRPRPSRSRSSTTTTSRTSGRSTRCSRRPRARRRSAFL